MGFHDRYNEAFTIGEIATVSALMTFIETGRYNLQSYGLVAVLDDKAGISYGKNQATENSGTLYLIVNEYIKRNGKFWIEMSSFVDRLYRAGGGEKGALTDNARFKELLKEAGEQDTIMQKAQRVVFHEHYMRPALALAAEYDIKIPLGLLVIYDICIQSGPSAAKSHLEKFNEGWQPPEKFDVDADGYVDERELTEAEEAELELAFCRDLAAYRKQWIERFKNPRSPGHTKAVRNSVYRNVAILDLFQRQLAKLPVDGEGLSFVMIMPSGRGKELVLTQSLIEEVEGLA